MSLDEGVHEQFEFTIELRSLKVGNHLDETLYGVFLCDGLLEAHGPIDPRFSEGAPYDECMQRVSELEHHPDYRNKIRVKEI